MSHDNLGFTSSTDTVHDLKKSSSSKEHQINYESNEKHNGVYALELEEKKKSVNEQNDDYEPYDYRVVEHPTTDGETLLHLLKGSLGTGILAMPKAFYNAGYVVGLIATIIIGLLCTYCMRILVRSEYELCKRRRVPSMTYPATAEAALLEGPVFLRPFSKASIHIINLFLMIYQMGTCCVYLVFISENLRLGLASFITMDLKIYMTILLLPLIFINYIRNLKFLAPFSTIANAIMFSGFAIILYYIFREPLSFKYRLMAGEVKNFPLFFGTVLFALESIGVIIALENNMKTPQYFGGYCGVLNIGMSVIVVLYIAMGFFGYLKYGDQAAGSVTFNLPQDEAMAQSIKIMFAIAIFITYALQAYVPVEIIWNTYLDHRIQNRKILWEYVCRTLVTLATFVLAIAIPRLGLFISLFGALCLSALGIAFPAIIEICVQWPENDFGPLKFMLIKNILLIVFGLLGLVVGTYVSIVDIVNSFQ
ncbi:hypothetical protein HN011_005914 [Eciton burchellii]|nr:hypothetical protein HN011_005914 [Eciton burchellii]